GEKAFDRIGLKVIPLSNAEYQHRADTQRAPGVLIVGGNVPPGLPIPSVLTKLDNNGVEDFDSLLNLVENRNQPLNRAYAMAGDKEYLFDVGPPTPAPQTTPSPVANGPVRPAAAPHHFPSLEDQKLSDLAFRRLGLELEPIGGDDLQRVKALGYD